MTIDIALLLNMNFKITDIKNFLPFSPTRFTKCSRMCFIWMLGLFGSTEEDATNAISEGALTMERGAVVKLEDGESALPFGASVFETYGPSRGEENWDFSETELEDTSGKIHTWDKYTRYSVITVRICNSLLNYLVDDWVWLARYIVENIKVQYLVYMLRNGNFCYIYTL
ncbi:hypothetical protein BDZ91DRAFT_841121 [Kalaharituber pfeilii]|nr:hypothetical protein BDZ91DRAFT_841121 [Kalaharituber pfeilii]